MIKPSRTLRLVIAWILGNAQLEALRREQERIAREEEDRRFGQPHYGHGDDDE